MWPRQRDSQLSRVIRYGRLLSRERMMEGVKLTIELDREEDGRWIAETIELPGVMCYGHTRDEAISDAERLAIEVIADRIAHGELPSSALGVSFTIPDEQLARQ
jgi:predicted RNase H-like HicB family nuclease